MSDPNPYHLPNEVIEYVETAFVGGAWADINALERKLVLEKQPKYELYHDRTPGLYIRRVVIPAGTLLTTRIHKFQHPFVITRGVVWVWQKETDWQLLMGPVHGKTMAGTRRVLYVMKEVEWTTYHVANEIPEDTNLVEYFTASPATLGHLDDLPKASLQLAEDNSK